jgi:hypothetical protein
MILSLWGNAMPKPSFKYYALHYLNLWISQDRAYCEALTGRDREGKLDAIARAAVSYKIARNLPRRYDEGKRYQPVREVLDKLSPADFKGKKLLPSIQNVRNQISALYGRRDFLSLTTKFLWLKIKSPIIIYDSRARAALAIELGKKARNFEAYDQYCSAWREVYKKYAEDIGAACQNLEEVHEYVENPKGANRQYVARIARQKWFQERVFDIYLWHVGAKPKRTPQ